MKRLKIWMFGCCCMVVMCSISCDDSSNGARFVLSDDEIDWLEQVGMKMYEGSSPPNIEGSYFLNSLTIAHDDLGLDHFIHDYTYSFDAQLDDEIKMSYAGPQAGDRALNLPVHIYGSGQCFSVMANVEASSNGCDYNMAQVISGCLSNGGIANWQLGIVMGAKSGQNCEDMLNENHRRVIREEDGLGEKVK